MCQVMAGYYKDPIATSKAIDRDGWFNTGDLGFINPVRWKHLTVLELGVWVWYVLPLCVCTFMDGFPC